METISPQKKLDQAFKTLKDPYDNLLSFSWDSEGYMILKLRANLLKNHAMFLKLIDILRTEHPECSLKVSVQPHSDYDAEQYFAYFRKRLRDIKSIKISKIPYEEPSFFKKYAGTAALMIGGAILAPFAVAGAVAAVGFTAGGIVAGSAAAGIMSASGGTVAAGSACAVLQSIGAAGLGAAGTTLAAGTGAAAGGIIGKVAGRKGRRNDTNKGASGEEEVKNDEMENLAGNDETTEDEERKVAIYDDEEKEIGNKKTTFNPKKVPTKKSWSS